MLICKYCRYYGECCIGGTKNPIAINANITVCCLYEPKQTIKAEPAKPALSDDERKASEAWCENCDHIEMCKWYPTCGCEFRQIGGKPAGRAEPVKHGRWVHHNGGYSDHFECTACGEDIVLTGKWRFCPNCGAQMDATDTNVGGKGGAYNG